MPKSKLRDKVRQKKKAAPAIEQLAANADYEVLSEYDLTVLITA